LDEGNDVSTKVCVVGVGAIGGFIGARLAAAGKVRVCALARGETLVALRKHGWRLRVGAELTQTPAHASASAAELGVQDLVFVAVKGPALSEVAQAMRPLLGPETVVVPAMNGVPWWFCQGLAGWGEAPLTSVDPGGRIEAAIARSRVLGCVVHASAALSEPGLVEHRMGNGLIVGEPDGGESARAAATVAMLRDAGFDATQSARIRYDIWYKLWGNLTMNPISAITGATADRVLDDPLVLDFCTAAMLEAQTLGRRIGCDIAQSPADRHAITRGLGAFKTSMLQDAQAGRAIELDAIVGVAHEISRRLGVASPNIAALLGLTRLFGRVHGLYPAA
jgi:2-dehydropantoate 2-reductase